MGFELGHWLPYPPVPVCWKLLPNNWSWPPAFMNTPCMTIHPCQHIYQWNDPAGHLCHYDRCGCVWSSQLWTCGVWLLLLSVLPSIQMWLCCLCRFCCSIWSLLLSVLPSIQMWLCCLCWLSCSIWSLLLSVLPSIQMWLCHTDVVMAYDHYYCLYCHTDVVSVEFRISGYITSSDWCNKHQVPSSLTDPWSDQWNE